MQKGDIVKVVVTGRVAEIYSDQHCLVTIHTVDVPIMTSQIIEQNVQEVEHNNLIEDYTTWSVKKFISLIERWQEDAWAATTREEGDAYDTMWKPVLKAFQELHPRAHKNWEQRRKENNW